MTPMTRRMTVLYRILAWWERRTRAQSRASATRRLTTLKHRTLR